jgi:hypothetical protein
MNCFGRSAEGGTFERKDVCPHVPHINAQRSKADRGLVQGVPMRQR